MIRTKVIPLLFLALSACVFDVPLSGHATIPIDSDLLGRWEALPQDPDRADAPEQLLVLKFSDTEYLVEHSHHDASMFFRAWLAELGGVRFVQLQVLGDNVEPVNEDDSDLYAVVSVLLEEDDLTVAELNTGLVDRDLQSTEALRRAFTEHKDRDNLFKEPMVYRRL